ncbi:hypothetical protein AGMMS49938_07400 [Fibrobacterales bacterium]|nr:hypothetical protein AGMMS49938_07400 [Fibrobacterales bacterium]
MRFFFILAVAVVFLSCSSGNKKEALYIPTDMPEICQNIDFNIDKDMRKACMVKPVRYQAYYNVPMQRYLINPNQASLVKTNGKIEIRFPNTHALVIDSTKLHGVVFSDSKRLSKIQNDMDYKEFYNEKKERFKLFKLKIPSDSKPQIENELCFRVPELKGSDRTRSVAMAAEMEMLSCEILDSLVATHSK